MLLMIGEGGRWRLRYIIPITRVHTSVIIGTIISFIIVIIHTTSSK